MAGPVETAVPGRGQIAGSIVAGEDFGQDVQIELSHLADVVGLVKLVDQGMNVGKQRHGRDVPLLVFAGVDDFPGGRGGMVEGSGEGGSLALVHPHILLEAEAFAIGKEKRFGEQERRAGENRGVFRGRHLLLDEVQNLRVLDEASAQGFEDIVHHDGGSLAFGYSFAGGIHLVLGQMVGVAGGIDRNVIGGLVVPFFQVRVLVLEGVGELVSQNRLLLVDVYPVEQVDGLGFGIVEGFNLLIEKREEKRLEVEVAVEEAELLEDDFSALETLGAFVLVEFFFQIAFDRGAGDESDA